MFYKNEDYTLRTKKVDCIEKYYIRFNFAVDDGEEIEISRKEFDLYNGEFRKPLDKQRNEERRHLIYGMLDIIDSKNDLIALDPACICQKNGELNEILEVVKSCTPTQRRRFEMRVFQGMNNCEIAVIEKCNEKQIRKTFQEILKKFQ